MPIEEKPQLLEFNCIIEGMDDISWNIKYDPNNKIGLQVSGNGQTFHCPVELFGDVTDFLQSKNIIKPNAFIKSRTTSTPGFEPGTFASTLTPPKVEGQTNTVVNNTVPSGPPMDALASFDITNPKAGLEYPQIVTTGSDDGPLPGSFTTSDAPVNTSPVKTAGTVVTPETKGEIINRTVIRTRVNKNDPQSAEKEAALIRGVGAAGAKKTIKKKHQIVE